MMTLTAGKELEEKLGDGADYVFLLDVSGSMAMDGKLGLSRGSIAAFVDALGEADRMELITFNVSSNPLFGSLAKIDAQRKEQATKFLESQKARGGNVILADVNAETGERHAARLGAAVDGPVDLVLDPLYGVPAAAAARCLRPGGRLVNLGGSASEHAPLDSSTIRSRSLRVLGYTNNELTRELKAAAMTAVAQHAAEGHLAVVHEVVALEDAADAWTRQAEGRTTGRLVLVP
jgi:threonine dehydrogenase-like Zn-dependent dehydrogenase